MFLLKLVHLFRHIAKHIYRYVIVSFNFRTDKITKRTGELKYPLILNPILQDKMFASYTPSVGATNSLHLLYVKSALSDDAFRAQLT